MIFLLTIKDFDEVKIEFKRLKWSFLKLASKLKIYLKKKSTKIKIYHLKHFNASYTVTHIRYALK
jgi:hypothetical protein